MNNRKFEIEHEKHVVGVAQLIDTVGKVLIDAGQPPRVVALQAQITCNQYGVSLEEVAKAQVIPWTMNAPSAMNELQEQDPRLYTYCLQNNYEVQKTRQGLFVTGGPDPNDPLDFMSLDLFRAIVYAGVRWMCDGIGLSKAQSKSQVEKINEDKVLSKGVGNFRLPTNGGLQDSFCLKLEYLPLWLAKINITPTMERETPELADRLEQYQLKAKDVLAAAFLPQMQTEPQRPHSYPPKSTSAGEVASLLKVLRSTMKENKRPPETISRQVELSCKQFGVETVNDFVGHSPFEQLTICLIEGGPI